MNSIAHGLELAGFITNLINIQFQLGVQFNHFGQDFGEILVHMKNIYSFIHEANAWIVQSTMQHGKMIDRSIIQSDAKPSNNTAYHTIKHRTSM